MGDSSTQGEERTDEKTFINRRRFLKAGGAATTAGLAGCMGGGQQSNNNQGSPQGSPQGSTVEFEIWAPLITESPRRAEYFNKIVTNFEKKYNAKINVTGVAMASLTEKFRSAQAAGDAPQLVIPGTHPGVLSAAKRIDDVYEGSATAKKIPEGIKSAYNVWNKQIAGKKDATAIWPLGIQTYFPLVREDWLNQAGLQAQDVDYRAGTLEYRGKFAEMCQKMKGTKLGKKSGTYPSATGMKQSDCEMLSMYIPQFGGSHSGTINEAGTKATIDSQAARDAIRMQFDFIEKGYFDPNSINMGDEEVTSKHWAGKLADSHIQDTGDSWTAYRENKPQLMDPEDPKLAFCRPYSGGTKTTLGQTMAIEFVEGTFKSQRQMDKAAQFADYWAANPRWAITNSTILGYLPLNPSVIEQKDYFSKSTLHKQYWQGAVKELLTDYQITVLPAVQGAAAITYTIPNRMYQRIAVQGWGIRRATSRAADEINKILAQHGRR
jgi:ABC-type glycerol-3-phosphate transport system substrate-binding protein